ncbi:SDR family NAD(P)-dependent oxidoreductase [Sphingomonas sp. PAMC 26605]|uniref:SDR family NAD(P)-dependent oxidoreductase n=1 Tax=Sphingomonas sp. PAMC 26605 TaxID=1112214 RepID=UPI00026CCAFF|nr:SDR family oxidoreductase [Sphingomonas sp. PAMC 26605]
MNIDGKRVLITGGSSGIGLATAHALALRGARLLVTGRRSGLVDAAVDALRATGADVYGVAADVATEDGRAMTMAAATRYLGGLDILMNNAGAVRAGRLEEIQEDEIRTMIEVDLVAPIMLARAALPMLKAEGGGMIVNVSSSIALVALPFYATYAAVKAGLASFGESLRRELNGDGVHVLTVYPSGTDTPMMATNTAGADVGFSLESAAAVAAAILDGIEREAIAVVRGGPDRQAMIDLNRDDPRAVDARFLSIKAAFEQGVRPHKAL